MADEVQPGLSDKEKALANALIETATSHDVTDPEVASAAAALLAGAVCGMLGLGDEGTSPEEYNEYANYVHIRIEEFVLSLMADITKPQAEGGN